MPWPKKQVIQFDPDTDYRIFRGAVGLDRHLWSLSSCLVQEGAVVHGQHVFTLPIKILKNYFSDCIFIPFCTHEIFVVLYVWFTCCVCGLPNIYCL